MLTPFTRSENISLHMQTAPAMRSAAMTADYVSRPRRRAIDAADLPAFSPLFCTALAPGSAPVILKGLKPGAKYHLDMHSLQDASWRISETFHASPSGEIQILFSHYLKDLQEQNPHICEAVWFLREESGSEQWNAGLIWLEGETDSAEQREIKRKLDQIKAQQADQVVVQQLTEISLLISGKNTLRHTNAPAVCWSSPPMATTAIPCRFGKSSGG